MQSDSDPQFGQWAIGILRADRLRPWSAMPGSVSFTLPRATDRSMAASQGRSVRPFIQKAGYSRNRWPPPRNRCENRWEPRFRLRTEWIRDGMRRAAAP